MNCTTYEIYSRRGLLWSLVAALGLASAPRSEAQGCVAVRPMGACSLPDFLTPNVDHHWQASVSFRYLYADRYFSGTEELPMPPGSQVINEIYTLDFAITYSPIPRVSLTADLPYTYGDRTSRHEHMGMNGPQFTTHADGIGDFRFTTDVWLLDPKKHPHGNIALGVGFKAPTGDDDAEDDFHTPSGVVHRPVDVAIQPGDGGWGAILQAQAYQQFGKRFSLYLNGLYMMNPQEVNDTPSFSPPDYPNQDYVNAIPDQYLARGGFGFVVWPKAGLSLSLGGRVEGIPVTDVFGGDGGFRRPGYIVSIEPGLNWSYRRHNLAMTAPVALAVNRKASVTDQLLGTRGDASFADYLILATYAIRF